MAALAAGLIMKNISDWSDIINRTSRCLIKVHSLVGQTIAAKER